MVADDERRLREEAARAISAQRAAQQSSAMERSGFHELAQAIRSSGALYGQHAEAPIGSVTKRDETKEKRNHKPLTYGLLIIAAVAIVFYAVGIPPVMMTVVAGLILAFVLLVWYQEDLYNPANIFFFAFLIFHLFVDAPSGFANNMTRYSTLFFFGVIHWALFIRPTLPGLKSFRDLGTYLQSLILPILAWIAYGTMATLLSYSTKLGVAQANINLILVMGPPVVFVFLFPGSWLIDTIKDILLWLTLIAVVFWIYNAGLAASITNIPGLQTSGQTADVWGALGNFGLLFWTPIKDGSVRVYNFILLPLCNAIFVYLSIFMTWLVQVAGGSGEVIINYCPAGVGVNVSGLNQSKSGGIAGWLDNRIAFATGQVEETKTEPPGVTMSSVELQTSAVENQPVSAKTRIRAVALDKPIDLNMFCKALGQTSNYTADEIIPSKTINVRAKEKAEKGIVCLFNALSAQTYSFLISTSFDFKTVTYLKVYFASSDDIDAAKSRDGWFSRYQISDRDPTAKYTPGPLRMGIKIEEPMPLVLYPKTAAQKVFLNVPLDNAYSGKIRKINRLTIAVPNGLSVQGVYGGKTKGDIQQITCTDLPAEDARGCDDSLFKLYDVIVSDKDVSSVNYRVILQVDDYSSLLGKSPPSTQYVKVMADYNYILEQRSGSLTVEKAAAPEKVIT